MKVRWACLVLGLGACSDPDNSPSRLATDASGGTAGSANGGTAGSANGGSAGSSGTDSGAGTAGDAGAAGGSDAGPPDPVELPPGSREFDGIVNLVNAEAAQQLEEFLLDQGPLHEVLRQGLTKPLNLFLDHYVEAYDFVIFVTDHVIDGVPVAGKFEAVNRRAMPGGGDEIEIAAGGYKTTGRTKAVIGIPYRQDYYPPLSHEVGHYWAAYLDSSFGFGLTLDGDYGPHWGVSSVNGQLGGFDASTLKCQTPAGAVPPGCTRLASGRTRYVVGAFGPNANGFRNAPFAPLELYLMGLLPASGVPASFQLLTDAHIDEASFDQTTNTLRVEASGITTLPFSAIVARHGNMTRLAEADRQFKAAFVVVSAMPASDKVMTDVATWAGVFGNRKQVAGWNSFETDTMKLATLDTSLQSRRNKSDPAPAPRERAACDVLAQDCGRPELGCYLWPPAFCALSGGVKVDQPCNALFACAKGLDCVASAANPNAYRCRPYCDPTNASAPSACAKHCNANFLTLESSTGQVLGALCLP